MFFLTLITVAKVQQHSQKCKASGTLFFAIRQQKSTPLESLPLSRAAPKARRKSSAHSIATLQSEAREEDRKQPKKPN
ncbi:MAG: hypothetical protein ABIM30_10170, partial [candidate division WOR-3 bacterium]